MRRGYKEALGRTVESAPAPKELSRRSERQDSATFDDEVADAGVPAEGAVDRSVVVNELGEDSVRTRLISAADALFYAEGIHAVGIDRVLGEAGVAKASLYNHFASRTIS